MLMKVAFHGVHGAYSDVAARRMLGPASRTMPMETFEEVFRAVARGGADRGVIPIENSLSGSIHQNYDLLLTNNLHIVGETYLLVEHVLMCHPASTLAKLKRVLSHPQALAQCSHFFSKSRQLHPQPFFDTAGAAKYIMETRSLESGAIASAYAARMYRLRVLRRNIQDQPNNLTRFLLISRKPWRVQNNVHSKSSICFRPVKNQPGILFRILGVFALRDIDLLKIESRPDREKSFEYQFYVDFAGNPSDRTVANALDHLREMTRDFRLLGSYPVGRAE